MTETEKEEWKQIPSFPQYYMNKAMQIRRKRADHTLKKIMTPFTARTSKHLRVELLTSPNHKRRVRLDALYRETFGELPSPLDDNYPKDDWVKWEYIPPANPTIPDHISEKGRGYWRVKK